MHCTFGDALFQLKMRVTAIHVVSRDNDLFCSYVIRLIMVMYPSDKLTIKVVYYYRKNNIDIVLLACVRGERRSGVFDSRFDVAISTGIFCKMINDC